MKKKKDRVLAVDPGTHHIGFAVFDGKELIHYGVKTILRGKPYREVLREGRKVIRMLLEDFRPGALLIERTRFENIKGSATLNKFTDEIERIGKTKRLRIRTFSANTVRKVICGNGWATKRDVAQEVCRRFPELRPYLSSDRRWKEEFYLNMFDAVALGMAYSHKTPSSQQ